MVGVILNLAVWFALHTIFREVRPLQLYLLSFDMPVLASVNLYALGLVVAALAAVFWLRIGMITLLGVWSLAGIALHFAGLVG